MKTLATFALTGALVASTPCALAASDLMSAARVHPPYHGVVPKRSDVIFSTRFTRPEALPVIQAYGATRVEWVYTKDPAFAAKLEQLAPWFGGALNANGPLPDEAGYARDFDGKVLAAPWMQGWGMFWVTTTHAATQKVTAEQVRSYVTMGADSLQHDDPQLQLFAALNQGGDFNDSTLRGFQTWLAQVAHPAKLRAAGLTGFDGDYREWLKKQHGVTDAQDYRKRFREFPSTVLWLDYVRSTVLEHHKRVRAQASALKGRPVPLSMNLGDLHEPIESNPFFFLAPAADYAIGETQIADLTVQVTQAHTARALGIGFVPSLKPQALPANRVAIAFFYALGGQPVVPWDVYDGNDDKGKPKRYFGVAEDYADLYAFARKNASLLDDTETTPSVGVVVPVDKGEKNTIRALSQRLVAQQVPFAFVPVGGATGYRADPARLRHLRLLITTNPDADYGEAALKVMADSGVPLVAHTAVRDEQIAGLRPFQVAPGGERLRLVPRANPAEPGRLLVHVVDAGRGDKAGADPECRRRIGVRRDYLGTTDVTSARWVQPSGSVDLSADKTGSSHVFFSVSGCTLWGVLDIRVRR